MIVRNDWFDKITKDRVFDFGYFVELFAYELDGIYPYDYHSKLYEEQQWVAQRHEVGYFVPEILTYVQVAGKQLPKKIQQMLDKACCYVFHLPGCPEPGSKQVDATFIAKFLNQKRLQDLLELIEENYYLWEYYLPEPQTAKAFFMGIIREWKREIKFALRKNCNALIITPGIL